MTKNSRLTYQKSLEYYSSLIVALVLIMLPFHAFFTTWFGANFGNIDLFRVWKEIITFLLALVCLYLYIKRVTIRKFVNSNFILKLIGLLIVLILLRGLYGYINGAVNTEALAYGLIIHLRYLVFFVTVWIISQETSLLRAMWQKILLLPAAAVTIFGILQQLVLPKDFLKFFGYGESTIPAYQTIDLKEAFARAQSTLRGPNPLGAYLIMPITNLVALMLKKIKTSLYIKLLLIAMPVLLYFTYSRSAWLGLAISTLSLVAILKISWLKKMLLVVSCSTILLSTGIYILRDNDYVQNVVFHSDETSLSATSSNEVRASSLKRSVQGVVANPLGSGVGTAGPASTRNDKPASISENYYIQLTQEAGVAALTLIIAITYFVARGLWVRRQEVLPTMLLTSLLGIVAINMISHAWADDTLAMLWWGFAGIGLSFKPTKTAILKHKR